MYSVCTYNETLYSNLYTWGQGGSGQLGHGLPMENKDSPHSVQELLGMMVTSVAAGSRHTIAVVSAPTGTAASALGMDK